MSLDGLTAQERHELGLPPIGIWAAIRFRVVGILRGKPKSVAKPDRFTAELGDSQAILRSKKRVKFLLNMMDSLTDRNLSPDKAIDVAMIWLKTPAALEDLEQWGGKREE